MWITRAAFGFFIAGYLLYPHEVGDWLRRHKPDLQLEVCVKSDAPPKAFDFLTKHLKADKPAQCP